MISTKEYVYSILSADTALAAMTGISSSYPEIIPTFPYVVFTDENQSDWEYADNKPLGSRVSVRVDVFVKINAGQPTTWDIGKLIYADFKNAFFNCGANGEVPDPTEGVRHRVMRFSRELLPEQI